MKPEPLDLSNIEKDVLNEYVVGISLKYIEEFQLEPEQIMKLLSLLTQEIKQRIKSACEFYLKYKDKPKQLIIDYPEYEEEVKRFMKGMFISPIAIIKYNEWLFRLAFKDVMEGDNNGKS